MRDYEIAFFTVDWNYDLVESTLHGLKRYVDEHENVRVRVFDCFGKDIGDARDWAEYAIFDLPDLTRFDGLLIQGNQVVLGAVRERIAQKIARAGIPAVTIDCPVEGCTLMGIDNRAAQRELTAHVIKCHGARHVVYLTGIMENLVSEGRQRMEGFMDACREAGLRDEDVEVIRCTWRASDGVNTAERWVAENRPLPDAFLCGNDEMALGLIEGLERHGYRVPRDVIVTGFDNITSAELSTPRLSTIHRDYERMNYCALDFLIAKIDGREHRDFIPFEYEPIFSESCGCQESARPAYIRDKYFQQTRFLKHFYTLQDHMAVALFDADDLPALMDIVEDNTDIFGSEHTCLCINEGYLDSITQNQPCRHAEGFSRRMALSACTKAGFNRDGAHIYERFPTPLLLPEPLLASERFLIFYPLHYNTQSIGYFAMDSISQAAKLNLHESVFSLLELAIENVRKKGLLCHLNAVLDELYVHDALTGLYNRFGFDRYAQKCFDAYLETEGGAQVLFVDMDDMKGVNDHFGHEVGDAAIRAAAKVLKQACDEGAFVMRYGGDEFLAITSRKQADIVADISKTVAEVAKEEALPCHLGLSVGTVCADNSRTLAQCIQESDVRMYDAKRQKKAG